MKDTKRGCAVAYRRMSKTRCVVKKVVLWMSCLIWPRNSRAAYAKHVVNLSTLHTRGACLRAPGLKQRIEFYSYVCLSARIEFYSYVAHTSAQWHTMILARFQPHGRAFPRCDDSLLPHGDVAHYITMRALLKCYYFVGEEIYEL